jgi:UDP-glucose 4-epimerase
MLGLADRVIALTESQSPVEMIPYDQAYAPGFEDMRRRVPNLEKIGRLLGYAPRYRLDDILRRIIAYERERMTGETAVS